MPPIAPKALRQRLAGEVRSVRYDGGRAVVLLHRRGHDEWLWFFLEDGYWRLDLLSNSAWQPADRGAGAPRDNLPTLREATAGIRGTGPLVAVFETSVGDIRCKLATASAPKTTAHFVSLARGLRASLDTSTEPNRWTRVATYDGTRFHRVAPGFAIHGGRPSGSKDGSAGMAIADEFTATLRHDQAGTLSLANRGPNTGSSQFFITLRAAPELDDHYSVFGACKDIDVVERVTGAGSGNVLIKRVTIRRGF